MTSPLRVPANRASIYGKPSTCGTTPALDNLQPYARFELAPQPENRAIEKIKINRVSKEYTIEWGVDVTSSRGVRGYAPPERFVLTFKSKMLQSGAL